MNRSGLPFTGELPLAIIKKLSGNPSGFLSKWQDIKGENATGASRRAAAGVLLLLCLRPDVRRTGAANAIWVFQLIKRSSQTSQGGDISCPGGMLHPLIDWAFSLLFIRSGILSGSLPHAGPAAEQGGRREENIVSMFFANTLREAWEELRLPPLRVSLLGALPTYSLHLFSRTIFPLVALARPDWTPAPNREVARFIEIPVASFFDDNAYGRYLIHAAPGLPTADQGPWEFPCLIHEQGGTEEILWGATFFIITNFLKIVFDHTLPDLRGKRTRSKTLTADYLAGSR